MRAIPHSMSVYNVMFTTAGYNVINYCTGEV